MKIYIVNGAPESGKTLFEQTIALIDQAYVQIYSSIDFVKEVAKKCGWNGKKTPENRKFLSDLKQLLIDWDDVPLKQTQEYIRQTCNYYTNLWMDAEKLVFFIDVREPQEIRKFCDNIPGAKSILIRRNFAEQHTQSNQSDANYLDYDYDYIIDNNSNKDDFIAAASKFYYDVIRGVD